MAKPNTGFLSENPRFEFDSDPDLAGYVIALCPCCNEETYFWMSAWDKKRDGKWVQTIAIRPRERLEEKPRRPRFERTG